MHTQCNPQQLEFAGVERRRVVAAFDGDTVSADGGALLLARTDAAIGLIDRLAHCFRDHRVADLVEHSVRTLVGQRVLGIAAGYEDLNDHDATDDPLHGNQEGRFFHGYYDHYCYLPLYIFCGRHLLSATLRPANIDRAAGAKEEVERLVAQICERWPETRIILRADSGFAREALMGWCEGHHVEYVFGLARNKRLEAWLAPTLARVGERVTAEGRAGREFAEQSYRTRDSWSRARRVIGKAEVTLLGTNPRFVVTSLSATAWEARALYEDLYCARGEMENRIKEAQLELFADRTSSHAFHTNQLRLWFSSFAYTLIEALRRLGLQETQFARASAGRIRLCLLKVGAVITVSVRRVKVALSSAYAWLPNLHNLTYTTRMRAVQPVGPYHLSGYCGGVIAFEMARQLRAQGEEVAFLGLIDSIPPTVASTLRSMLYDLVRAAAERHPPSAVAQPEEGVAKRFGDRR